MAQIIICVVAVLLQQHVSPRSRILSASVVGERASAVAAPCELAAVVLPAPPGRGPPTPVAYPHGASVPPNRSRGTTVLLSIKISFLARNNYFIHF